MLPEACGGLWHEVRKAAIAIAAAPKDRVFPVFIKFPLWIAACPSSGMTCFPGIRMHDSVRVGKPGMGRRGLADHPYNARMLSLVVGTAAFFVVSYRVCRD